MFTLNIIRELNIIFSNNHLLNIIIKNKTLIKIHNIDKHHLIYF